MENTIIELPDTKSDTEYFTCSSGESDNEDEYKIISISTGLLFLNKQLYDNINNLPNNLPNLMLLRYHVVFLNQF